MDKKLILRATLKFLTGSILLSALLFIPAGSLSYTRAWLLIGLLFVPMFTVGAFLLMKNPELLRKRLNSKEEQPEQKTVVLLSGLMFVAAFVAAGLSYRFDLLMLPVWVSLAASVIFLTAYALYAEVLRENAYLSRTVEVQEGQKLIDTGLYAAVRHPMYMSTLLLFLSMPLVLGSAVSFVIMLLYIPIIARRILSEERILEDGLEGYAGYKKRVRYRIIPFIW